jgi:hypothetical protein
VPARVAELVATCALVLTFAFLPACYQPSIDNGRLACSIGTSQCPAGYVCLGGHCWSRGTGPDGSSGEDMMCAAPTLCGGQSGNPCDPVCQTGACDWCSQKCSFSGDGATVCSSRDNGGTRPPAGSCTLRNPGQPDESDDCVPGNICLYGEAGAAGGHCFALCRTSVDCPGNVACGPRPLPASGGSARTVNVCNVVPTKCDSLPTSPCCDPINATTTPCPSGSFCYLATADSQTLDSRTSCEFSTGTQAKSNACQSSRDCLQKLGCAPDGFCHIVCSAEQTCSTGPCVLEGNQFGYCPL